MKNQKLKMNMQLKWLRKLNNLKKDYSYRIKNTEHYKHKTKILKII